MHRILITLPDHIAARDAESAVIEALVSRFHWTHGQVIVERVADASAPRPGSEAL